MFHSLPLSTRLTGTSLPGNDVLLVLATYSSEYLRRSLFVLQVFSGVEGHIRNCDA